MDREGFGGQEAKGKREAGLWPNGLARVICEGPLPQGAVLVGLVCQLWAWGLGFRNSLCPLDNITIMEYIPK